MVIIEHSSNGTQILFEHVLIIQYLVKFGKQFVDSGNKN